MNHPLRINTWRALYERIDDVKAAAEYLRSSDTQRGGYFVSTDLFVPTLIEQALRIGQGQADLTIGLDHHKPLVLIEALAIAALRLDPALAALELPSAKVDPHGRQDFELHAPYFYELLAKRCAEKKRKAAKTDAADPNDEDDSELFDRTGSDAPKPKPATMVAAPTSDADRATATATSMASPVVDDTSGFCPHILVDPVELTTTLKQVELNTRSAKTELRQLKANLIRWIAKASKKHLEALDTLDADFPNFAELIDRLRGDIHFQMALGQPFSFRPLLLVGPPGIGKTEFAKRAAKLLSFQHLHVECGGVSASWILRGNHSGWSGGQVGEIARSVMTLPKGQSLLLQLDEIDKMRTSTTDYPVQPVLLELLEPAQAAAFKDEYLGVHLNLVPILSLIATANDMEKISTPLLSRLDVVHVSQPTREQMPAVVRSVDRSLRERQPGFAQLFHPLSKDAVACFGCQAPRDLQRTIQQSYVNTIRRQLEADTQAQAPKPWHVGVEDITAAIASRQIALDKGRTATEARESDGFSPVLVLIPNGGNGPTGGQTPPRLH